MRTMPSTRVQPVVTAMVGNPLISGVPMASALLSMSLFSGIPDTNSTTPGTVIPRMSGGCTIGPNRLRRCTAHTAATAPMKYAPWNSQPSECRVCMSMTAPTTASPKARSTAPHHGKPRRSPTMGR